MAHGYEGGRLDLPFVGICTFGRNPYVADWDAIDAGVAVLGAPFDAGTQWRAGASSEWTSWRFFRTTTRRTSRRSWPRSCC